MYFIPFLLIPVFILSAGTVTIGNPLGTEDVGNLVQKITNAIAGIAGAIAVAAVVYGAVMLMISGGESKKVEDAKKTITYAIVGLVIIGLAYPIINFVIGALR